MERIHSLSTNERKELDLTNKIQGAQTLIRANALGYLVIKPQTLALINFIQQILNNKSRGSKSTNQLSMADLHRCLVLRAHLQA
jgi:hypothetical protein